MDLAAAVPAAIMAIALQGQAASNQPIAAPATEQSGLSASPMLFERVDIQQGAGLPQVQTLAVMPPAPLATGPISLVDRGGRVSGRIAIVPRSPLPGALPAFKPPIAPELEEIAPPEGSIFTGPLRWREQAPAFSLDTPFADLIKWAAADHALEPALVAAVIRAESSFNPHAVSPVGARGLMQIMPDTARGLGLRQPYTQLFDPQLNVHAGARYLRQMLDMFGDTSLALAAYNAGPGAVRRYGNRIPPFRETRNYVRRVLEFYGELTQGGARRTS